MRGGCDTWNKKPGQMKYELFKCISQDNFMELTHNVWYPIGKKIDDVLKREGITQYGQVWTDKIIEKYLSNHVGTDTEAIQLLVPGYVPKSSNKKIIEQFMNYGNNDDVWWKDYAQFSNEAIEVKNEKDAYMKAAEEAKKAAEEAKKAAEEAKKAAAAERQAIEDAKRVFDESPAGKNLIRQKNQAEFYKMQEHFAKYPGLTYTLTPNNYGKR
jgi:predicted flap endonuclease-1-like 5' DNA nuclease